MNVRKMLAGVKSMPIGADLILKARADHREIAADGLRLAEVLIEAAHRFRTPLAAPVMDLTLEKHAICSLLGVAPEAESTFHFGEPLADGAVSDLSAAFKPTDYTHMKANIDAVAAVARRADADGVIPTGMAIGPFSLATKLMAEPITPVYMKALGLAADEEPSVKLLDQLLELCCAITLTYIEAQLDAGARIIFVAEPAANLVYISPKQLEAGSGIFESAVMQNLRKVKALIDARGAHLFFHCCGELTDAMVESFASLKPTVMSLGCSRDLAHDAGIVDEGTTLFGNLPSKKFFSDSEITAREVYDRSIDLLGRMRDTGHAFILGSECDVLSVSGCEDRLMSKVAAMQQAADDFYSGQLLLRERVG